MAVVACTIFAPITDELSSRRYFQPKLEARFGKWVGLVIIGVLFMIIYLPKVLLTPLATLANLPTFGKHQTCHIFFSTLFL